MIRPWNRTANRGWSLVDVAVAFTLLAFAFLGAARFVVALAEVSETSVARAAARREIAIAEELIEADFSNPVRCGADAISTPFAGFGTPETGGDDSIGVFVDANIDGAPDLVGWRVNAGTLQRALVVNPGSTACEALTLESASWEDVLAPVDVAGGTGVYFSAVRDGFDVALMGSCTDGSVDCEVDGVRVALTASVSGASGPVRLEQVHPVPGRVL